MAALLCPPFGRSDNNNLRHLRNPWTYCNQVDTAEAGDRILRAAFAVDGR
jgi:hypothetical protein